MRHAKQPRERLICPSTGTVNINLRQFAYSTGLILVKIGNSVLHQRI
jgi:hypothetical protein